MTDRNEHSRRVHGDAGYADVPMRVPFIEVVEPLIYVGEEVARLGSAAISATTRVAAALVRWHNMQSTIKALRTLDDRMLNDIGVRREDITAVARKLANG